MNEDDNYISTEVVTLMHQQWKERIDYVLTHLVSWAVMIDLSGIILTLGYCACRWILGLIK